MKDVEKWIREGVEFLTQVIYKADNYTAFWARNNELPSRVKRFPGRKVGDYLWHGDLTDAGIGRSIIVAMDKHHHALVVAIFDETWKDEFRIPIGGWACDWYHESAAEAVTASAVDDINYHRPRLDHAQAALDAAQSGGDLTKFYDAFRDRS